MAQEFYSINQGQNYTPANVLQATSAPSADFYFQVLSTHSVSKLDAVNAIEAIKQFILSDGIESGSTGSGSMPQP